MSFKDYLFNKVHGNKLIYNCCWEDPACDRKLLQLDESSELLMITSAGCNALDYLLDNPKNISCLDLNFRQNALLDLKIALFKNGDYSLLWDFFGRGKLDRPKEVYKEKLRPQLIPTSQKYWDTHINYFSGKGLRRSFYFRGGSGLLAWFASLYFSGRPTLKNDINRLFTSRREQNKADLYQKIETALFNSYLIKSFNNSAVLSLAGVPAGQHQLLSQNEATGTISYLQKCFRNTFFNTDPVENYFYKLYFYGEYDKECCPNYLKEENFDLLVERVDKITIETAGISDHLEKTNRAYTHFVLLDHMDWLAENDLDELKREWSLINKKSTARSKVLFRSAATDYNFLPEEFFSNFSLNEQEAKLVSQKDRVGMYQLTALAEKNC
ncbi:MAG: DUF3419 family protein [Saprospirales bacterium]|nr:MAG: DUF3419 family protein [Saprospirales bacterium]